MDTKQIPSAARADSENVTFGEVSDVFRIILMRPETKVVKVTQKPVTTLGRFVAKVTGKKGKKK